MTETWVSVIIYDWDFETCKLDKYSIMKSKKVYVLLQYPSLAVGVTQIDPRDWDFETWKFTKTWTMHTSNGATHTDESEEPGLCTPNGLPVLVMAILWLMETRYP